MSLLPKKTVKQRVDIARTIFLSNHSDLIRRRASERAITHKFAEALQIVFPEWHVDCEYNRDAEIPKRISLPENPSKTVFPDVVVHHRGTAENLLIIEAKLGDAPQTEIDYDLRKLEAYMSGRLRYRFWLFATFEVGGNPAITYQWQK